MGASKRVQISCLGKKERKTEVNKRKKGIKKEKYELKRESIFPHCLIKARQTKVLKPAP